MLSVLPPVVSNELAQGRLPVLNVDTLVPKSSEVCHFVGKACLFTKKIERHYRRRNRGSSFRITKVWYYHTGSGESHPEEYEIPVYTAGYLYITNQRIIFVAREKGFEKSIKKLTSVIGYSDAVGLQFGDKTYNLLLPSSRIAQDTLSLLT